jgi:Protein of unknown function (DUF1559)
MLDGVCESDHHFGQFDTRHGVSSMGASPNELDSSAPPTRPFQFRLTDALLATAWVAVLSAIITQVRPVELTSLIAFCWCLLPFAVACRSRALSIGQATAVVCAAVVVMYVLLPSIEGPREPSRRTQCLNNIHQISLALAAYEQAYGCLPPAYIADAQGKPMHSWRVLILPFMEQQALYERYDFSEPWDGPNNSKLHATLVPIFCCPSDSENPGADTNYVAVVGPGTAWPGATSTSSKMVTDGLSDTILLVEVANSGIHWMEPRDLPIAAVGAGINPSDSSPGAAISSGHPGIIICAFTDGRCVSLTETMPVDALNALLTIRGGERLSNHGDGYTILAPVAKPQAPP